jgi:hypothetical protein
VFLGLMLVLGIMVIRSPWLRFREAHVMWFALRRQAW